MTIYGDREKCYKCYRPKSSCMCGYIQAFDTNTKFVILMHPKEFKKVKNNTGFFTHLTLQNSELFIGIDFNKHKRINEIINKYESFILYPSVDAIDISVNNPLVESKKDMAIFIIDATWSCAKQIFEKSKNLKDLGHLSFTTNKTSQYQIKVQPESNYLSTIESTHHVIELLNGWGVEKIDNKYLDNFLNPFFEMIKYQQELIKNPLSNSVRYKPKSRNLK
ncbi:DTW domain-containing protein [Sulfurimonas lithotrophica]|uniref:tRNA-uridine aminocarboxypropyltransferase n=1 Tax=Sulfurimonas lithotrophica TaxID=2590022 RepID=A0A5P8P1F3_9BACT|nr:tRNA-uridine aminocarboxypropyltransferase [Sulfurimonas lithotrophica]QFR49441.1 DTW domain-containing protein [Sulfurimonas lithotrophica]